MSQIDRTSERPPFRQIADELRAKIARGKFSPGDKIPSARQLAANYQVTLSTAQRALTELHAAGLVVAAHGIGTIVRQQPPIHRLDRERWQPHTKHGFPDSVADHQATIAVDVRQGTAPERITRLLAVKPYTEVLIRERVMSTDGEPPQLATSYVPLPIAEQIPQLTQHDTGPEAIYARLEKAGYQLAIRETVGTRMPVPEEARALKLSLGVPLLTITRVVGDSPTERVLEVCDLRLAGDRYELTYTL
jgi:GntR family transcriptional regulator